MILTLLIIKSICFILLIFTKQAKSVPASIPTNNFSTIIEAAEYVINNFYIRATTTILISHKSSKETFHSDIINEITHKINSVAFLVDILIKGFDYQLWYYHVIVVDGAENFRWLSSRIKRDDKESFYLILLVKNDRKFKEDIEDILNISWNNFMINVNILVEESPGLVIIYSFFPFNDPNNCTKITPVIINRFENSSMENRNNIFPKKLTNMNKCPFYITTWNNPPYNIFTNNTIQTGRFYGLEGDLLDAIGANVNFTPKIIVSEIGRGDIYMNGTTTGTFKKLENEANITIGSLRLSEIRSKYATPSVVIHQDLNIFVVNDEIVYSPLARLFLPFHYQVWICIAIILIIGVLVITILDYCPSSIRNHIVGENNNFAVLNMIAGLLGVSVIRNKTSDISRYLLLIWLVVATIFRCSYQGAIYDFLRKTKTIRPPNTFDELITGKYSIYCSISGFTVLGYSPALQARSIITPSTIEESLFKLIMEQPQSRLAALSTRGFVRVYIYNNPQSTLHILEERVLLQNDCIYFRKGSVFKHRFDELIIQFLNSGFVQHWSTRYTGPENSKRFEVNTLPKTFDNSNLAGAYEILFVMSIGCFIVFLLEMLSVQIKPLRTLFRWAEYKK